MFEEAGSHCCRSEGAGFEGSGGGPSARESGDGDDPVLLGCSKMPARIFVAPKALSLKATAAFLVPESPAMEANLDEKDLHEVVS
jgi:hypothetical protein